MPSPIRGTILADLSDKELQALELALSKRVQTPEFRTFHTEITQIQQKRLLQEILADHPSWNNPIEAWKDVSLENKIWLLQLYELRNLGVAIPQIIKQEGSECIPSQLTLDLLKPDIKTAITAALNVVTTLDWSRKQLKKCPRTICLLANLQEFVLRNNELTAPPDVRNNANLQRLDLDYNQLTAPPDVRNNVNLQRLDLSKNQLTNPPDVRNNVNLQGLILDGNQLTEPPDVNKNGKLQWFHLHYNPLTSQAKQALEKLKKERTNLKISY